MRAICESFPWRHPDPPLVVKNSRPRRIFEKRRDRYPTLAGVDRGRGRDGRPALENSAPEPQAVASSGRGAGDRDDVDTGDGGTARSSGKGAGEDIPSGGTPTQQGPKLKQPAETATPVAGKAAEGAASKVPPQLEAGVQHEASRLQSLGLDKNTNVWRPTEADVNSAAFKVIVGDAKYTASGLEPKAQF